MLYSLGLMVSLHCQLLEALRIIHTCVGISRVLTEEGKPTSNGLGALSERKGKRRKTAAGWQGKQRAQQSF